MIKTIQLKNFKSLKDTGLLHLGSIAILTGLNSMGKSSLVQMMLAMRQSENLSKGLTLRNGLVNLGTVEDVLFSGAEQDEIFVKINENEWLFDASKSGYILGTLHSPNAGAYGESSIFTDGFQYISAARIAQEEMHDVSSFIENGYLGTKGEFVVHYLEAAQVGTVKVEIPPILRHPQAMDYAPLLEQTDAWLGEISPGIKVFTQQNTSEQIQLGFSFTGSKQTKPYKPKNVGFGISYSLAIIVALLISKKGSLVVIENPEAHLHPRGQAKLGELISKAARNGAQIILETHSDHVLNGIRVMNRLYFNDLQSGQEPDECRGISNEAVTVLWFDRNMEDFSTYIETIHIEPNARIKRAPDGFFDQMDSDLKKILGFSDIDL